MNLREHKQEMIDMWYKDKLTYTEIGKKFGVSRQRIHLVINDLPKPKPKTEFVCNVCKNVYLSNRKRIICDECIYAPRIEKDKSKNIENKKVFKLEKYGNLEGKERTRMLVRIRDNFTCQDCGAVRTYEEVKKHNSKLKTLKGKKRLFDVHHLNGLCGKLSKSYDRIDMIPNLITLCHKCHFNRPEHTTQRKNLTKVQSTSVV